MASVNSPNKKAGYKKCILWRCDPDSYLGQMCELMAKKMLRCANYKCANWVYQFLREKQMIHHKNNQQAKEGWFYFNNDVNSPAIANAKEMIRMVGYDIND